MRPVPRFHHVNLGVVPGGLDAEASFLVDVLGYRRLDVDDRLRAVGATWFEAEDGSQVHLSEDPEHRPAARAHVALEFGSELPAVQRRLEEAEVKFRSLDQIAGPQVLVCRDPAGNRWELRGSAAPEAVSRG
jgi:catechol 2,3-dioxygenase-like lactoylglutathione lyase family enzyme